MDHHLPSVDQQVLAEFMAAGAFERHLRRLRRVYRARRAALATPLSAGLGSTARVVTADGGLQLVVRLAAGCDERRVIEAAAARQVAVAPLSAYYTLGPPPAGLVLGFAALDEADLAEAAVRLIDAVS